MRILALDLSIAATGVCSEYGQNADGTISDLQLNTWSPPLSEGDRRARTIKLALVHELATKDYDLVLIEGGVFRSQAAFTLGQVHGCVKDYLWSTGRPFLLVAPAAIKRYATGKGTVQKADMRMALYKRTGLDVSDDNQVDAAWLWLLGHHVAGDPRVDMPKGYTDKLGKLVLPQITTVMEGS